MTKGITKVLSLLSQVDARTMCGTVHGRPWRYKPNGKIANPVEPHVPHTNSNTGTHAAGKDSVLWYLYVSSAEPSVGLRR